MKATTIVHCPHCGRISLQDDEGLEVEATQDNALRVMVTGKRKFDFCTDCNRLSPEHRKSMFDQTLLNYYNAIVSITGTAETYEHEPLMDAIAFLGACILKNAKEKT